MGLLDVGLGLLGPIGGAIEQGISDYANYQQQERAMEWEKKQYEETKTREDTAVQRRVADLKAAGLSPVLAAGSAASTSSPVHINAPQWGGGIVQSAIQAAQGQKNIAQTNASIAATNLQAKKTDTEGRILSRELDVNRKMNLFQSDSLGNGGTVEDEAMRRIKEANARVSEAEAKAQKAWGEKNEQAYNLALAESRGIRSGGGTTQDLADVTDYLMKHPAKGGVGFGLEALRSLLKNGR